MAETTEKAEQSAEKAYAEAAAAVDAAPAEPVKAAPAEASSPEPVAAPARAAAKSSRPVRKPQTKATKAEAKKAPARKTPAKTKVRVARAPRARAAKQITTPQPTITELKEKIMATAKTPDFSKPMADALGEMQTRAKAAYEKGTEAMTEATEFAKGNVEAFVESGKIFAAGAQDLSKTYVDEAKSAYETLTTDFKELAAVKSPTELFQLQGKIMRRNFDSLVATGSKNTEAFVKLATDSFAPISGRVNLAAEKLSKAA